MKPYARAQTIPLEGLEDRRRVLTDAQKQEIRDIYAKGGIGTRPLARMFGCSRSLVKLLVNPEAAERTRARMKEHWREYARKYGKAYHAAAVRNTRNYKYRLMKHKETT
jgi:hypothetical protein